MLHTRFRSHADKVDFQYTQFLCFLISLDEYQFELIIFVNILKAEAIYFL